MEVGEWLEKMGWRENPFTLKISPELFVGYSTQRKAAENQIKEGHKMTLILGPTGSGKTSMLKWLERTQGIKTIYLTKPPKDPREFIEIFTEAFPRNFIEKLLGRRPSLYTLSEYVNKKSKGKFLFLVDEAHETNKDVLEWLRVLTDQMDGVCVFLAGLPKLETKIKANLETLDQRITARINLTNLTAEETRELIMKRIESVGGRGLEPFTDSAVSEIYRRTNGFPREIIKLCNNLINSAIENGKTLIEARDVESYKEFSEKPEETVVSSLPKPKVSIEDLPQKQRKILKILSQDEWMTPSEIAEKLGGNYKTKDHGIRSVNNILKRLMNEGFVQRESRGKAFVYSLTPKVKAYFVEA